MSTAASTPVRNTKVMNRFDLTSRLIAKLKHEEAVIGGIGNTNFDLWAAGHRPQNWYMLGSMGLAFPIALGVYLLATQTWINWSFWQVGGGGRPQSVLYGIWNVEHLSVDGQARPAELNDYDRRWRRVIFDAPDIAVFQRTDDSFARFAVSIDEGTGTLALTKGASRTWSSRFTFDRISEGRLSLEGEMDGHRIQADLRRIDPSAFPLLNSSFRWVRPHDP